MAPQIPSRSGAAMSDSKPKQKITPRATGKIATGQKHLTKTAHSRGEPTTKSMPKVAASVITNKKPIPNIISLKDPFIAVDFEVHGRVQGVFFRKHTQQQADKLGVRGWCKNTEQGTVLGQLQGNRGSIEPMKKWLRSVGSPKSGIEKCEFRGEHEIDTITIEEFQIRR